MGAEKAVASTFSVKVTEADELPLNMSEVALRAITLQLPTLNCRHKINDVDEFAKFNENRHLANLSRPAVPSSLV